jgi:hypothetical protein
MGFELGPVFLACIVVYEVIRHIPNRSDVVVLIFHLFSMVHSAVV